MLLCFVDESNTTDSFGFAGVIADEHATKSLTQQLNTVMNQASVDYAVPRETELHGYPLFHGKEAWSGVGARARVQVFEDAIDRIVAADVTILLRSVSASALAARQAREHYPVIFPPEQVCFQHILQRLDALCGTRACHALIIADERNDRERHRARFATYQTRGTPGVYMHSTLSRLLDTVHFAPSHHSRMLQAADILAFTFRRRMTVTESDARSQATMDRIWGKVIDSGKVHDRGSWP